jgi:hypothetical protein
MQSVAITTQLWVRIQLWRGVLDITLCDKVCQWLATGRGFSPGTLVSPTNKTDRHDIAKILLKVVSSTIKQTTNPFNAVCVTLCYLIFNHKLKKMKYYVGLIKSFTVSNWYIANVIIQCWNNVWNNVAVMYKCCFNVEITLYVCWVF